MHSGLKQAPGGERNRRRKHAKLFLVRAKRGPQSARPTFGVFQRQPWGNFYGLSWTYTISNRAAVTYKPEERDAYLCWPASCSRGSAAVSGDHQSRWGNNWSHSANKTKESPLDQIYKQTKKHWSSGYTSTNWPPKLSQVWWNYDMLSLARSNVNFQSF